MTSEEDKIIVFMTFRNPIKANIIKTRLESNGISCYLTDENIISINPLFDNSMGGIKLNIFEKDIIKAQNIPSEDNELETDMVEGDIKCPKCFSNNVVFSSSSKKKFSFFTVIISLLFLVYPFRTRKVYYCFNCGNEFKLKK